MTGAKEKNLNKVGKAFAATVLVGLGKLAVRTLYGEGLIYKAYMTFAIFILVGAVMIGLKACSEIIQGQE
ncbi:hypothetical protein [Geobacter anodireducens]|nr:hypothetical protein RW64_09255 [Geobacter sulfurreducens]